MDVASVLAGELGFGASAREAFISLQTNQKESSNADGIFWRHTIKETSSLWLETHLSKKGAAASKVSSSDFTEGFNWLWVEGDSEDVLPGLEETEIHELMPDSEGLDEADVEHLVPNLEALEAEEEEEEIQQTPEILARKKAELAIKQHNT